MADNLEELRENAVPEISFDTQTFPITAGTTFTYNHGFAGRPRMVQLVLKCITAEWGYLVGDEVFFSTSSSTSNISVGVTNTEVIVSTVGLPVIVSVVGNETPITAANWNLEVRLER